MQNSFWKLLLICLVLLQEVLGMLEGLSKDRFATLLNNWHRARSGRFKVPIFAHQELDLHRVFWEVMRRGGFPVVTEAKQWKARAPASWLPLQLPPLCLSLCFATMHEAVGIEGA